MKLKNKKTTEKQAEKKVEKFYHPLTEHEYHKHCDRCGNPGAERLLYLPFEKKYVSLCYICFFGLKKYFQNDSGNDIAKRIRQHGESDKVEI